MKPATAAKKLGVYLPATPAEFQASPITRADLDDLRDDPPAWLEHERTVHREVLAEEARLKELS